MAKIKYAIVLIEDGKSMLGFFDEPHAFVLGVRDDIRAAEEYRTFVIKEDDLNPNSVSVVQYQ
jgi:hypothetical protein